MHFSRLVINNRIAFTSSAAAARQASILLGAFLVGAFLSSAGVVFYSYSGTVRHAASYSPPLEAKLPELGTPPEIASPVVEAPAAPLEAPAAVQAAEPAASAPVVPVLKDSIYTLKPGDNLTKIWKAAGAPLKGAMAAAKAFGSAGINVSMLKAGDKVSLSQDASGDIVKFVRRFRDGRILTLEGASASGYKSKVTKAEMAESEKQLSGLITHSFSMAALDAHVPKSVADDLVDLFGGRVEFRRDLHPGDTFSVVYGERIFADGEEGEPGPIVAASIQQGDRMMVAVRHVGSDGVARYFDENGAVLGNYFLRYPVQFSRISSVFASARFHPLLGFNRPHNGVDFAAPTGTAVRSVADGVVLSAGYHGEGGNTVIVRHDDRYSTAYMHLSKIASGLHAGSRVGRGQTIGAVGMSGLATGPHLHFSLFDRGAFVDPLKAKLPTIAPKTEIIPPQYLQAKLDVLKRSHQMLAMISAPALSRAG